MLKSKDEVFETFPVWKKMVENQTGRKIKVLRSDNGTEYRNDQISYFCKKEGISRHFTVRDTPQQNGVAERMNRTLLEKVRCMLSNAGLGKQFWTEAVMYAIISLTVYHQLNEMEKHPWRYGLENLQMIMILYMCLVPLLIIM